MILIWLKGMHTEKVFSCSPSLNDYPKKPKGKSIQRTNKFHCLSIRSDERAAVLNATVKLDYSRE
jgi:hypothetical protein